MDRELLDFDVVLKRVDLTKRNSFSSFFEYVISLIMLEFEYLDLESDLKSLEFLISILYVKYVIFVVDDIGNSIIIVVNLDLFKVEFLVIEECFFEVIFLENGYNYEINVDVIEYELYLFLD